MPSALLGRADGGLALARCNRPPLTELDRLYPSEERLQIPGD